jgi:uncharacterized protein (TIGR02588 family)
MSNESKNWLEWTVFGMGCVLVMGAMGVLVYQVCNGSPRKPAALDVSLGEPEKREGLYAIPVNVTNHGDETAETVHVRVELEKSDGETEQAEFELQFVPQHATQRGYAIVETDPATATKITARPLGYQRP